MLYKKGNMVRNKKNMTKEDLCRLQKTQTEMLKMVVEICRKYSIMYYVMYGTLLGTIRHGGTIPWDYDIDICMPREDYLRFREHMNELPEEYRLANVGAGKNSYTGLVRVYKNNTRMYLQGKENEPAYPIHIDIFLLDKPRTENKAIKKVCDQIAKYLMIAKLSPFEKEWLYRNFHGNKLKCAVIRSGDLLLKIFDEDTLEKWVHIIEVSDNPKIKRKYTTIIINDMRLYPKEWFGKGRLYQYEDIAVRVPTQYKKILRTLYGDYMTPPPEDKRFTKDMEKWKIDF